MAHREHQDAHALLSRPCERCGRIFDYCGSCEPGRLYCCQECSEAARDEGKHEARVKYAARDTPEGLKAHADEEGDRRRRRADAKLAESQRVQAPAGIVEPAMPALPMTARADGSRPEARVSACFPVVGGICPVESVSLAEESQGRSERAHVERVGDHRFASDLHAVQESLLAMTRVAAEDFDALPEPAVVSPFVAVRETKGDWILVAWPEALAAARQRLGTEASCPLCGRRGRIVRVVSLDEWRRWVRRGLDPPT